MIIYKTTNLVNGKFYVGKDAKNSKHYYGSGTILNHAIKKYGKKNFKKEILEYCKNLEELDIREKYWISELNAVSLGYNLTDGGTGGDTWTHNKLDVHWNIGNTAWNTGIPCTNETKHLISETKLQQHLTSNKTSYKSGKEHPFYGKKRDPKIYEKIIATRKEHGNIGKGLNKPVKNIEDNLEFESCKAAAKYYGITSDRVTYSCRTQFKKSKFRFIK